MSTTTLTGLRDFLYSTLTTNNMLWLGTQLTERAKEQEGLSSEPYSKDDIEAMVTEGVRQAVAGLSQDSDEMFRELKEEFTREEHEESVAV